MSIELKYSEGKLGSIRLGTPDAVTLTAIPHKGSAFVDLTVRADGVEVAAYLDIGHFWKLMERSVEIDAELATINPSVWLDGSPNSHEHEERPPEPAAQVLRAVVPDEGGES